MRRFVAAVVAVAAIAGLTVWNVDSPTPTTPSHPAIVLPSKNVPRTITACPSGDISTQFQTFLNNLGNNTTITLPHCVFTLNSTVILKSKTNLTIHGNGAVLSQPLAGDGNNFDPILDVFLDTNLKIDNLTLNGNAGGTGNEGTEGKYGIYMEADNGFLFTHSKITDTEGDWATATFAQSSDVGSYFLPNTGLVWTFDTFFDAGYHGFVDESTGCLTLAPCNGWTIAHSTMTNMNEDAMDWEVDDAASFVTNGQVGTIAQDDVTILDNTWTNWNADWFASLNFPNVQELNLKFIGNQYYSDGAWFDVQGTDRDVSIADGGLINGEYATGNFVIENNVWHLPFGPVGYNGGPNNSQLSAIYGLTMMNNVNRWCHDLINGACLGTPADHVAQMFDSGNVKIKNNDFSGYAGVIDPGESGGNVATTCTNNLIGVWQTPTVSNTC